MEADGAGFEPFDGVVVEHLRSPQRTGEAFPGVRDGGRGFDGHSGGQEQHRSSVHSGIQPSHYPGQRLKVDVPQVVSRARADHHAFDATELIGWNPIPRRDSAAG